MERDFDLSKTNPNGPIGQKIVKYINQNQKDDPVNVSYYDFGTGIPPYFWGTLRHLIHITDITPKPQISIAAARRKHSLRERRRKQMI